VEDLALELREDRRQAGHSTPARRGQVESPGYVDDDLAAPRTSSGVMEAIS
jgi:hypothetical protein